MILLENQVFQNKVADELVCNEYLHLSQHFLSEKIVFSDQFLYSDVVTLWGRDENYFPNQDVATEAQRQFF